MPILEPRMLCIHISYLFEMAAGFVLFTHTFPRRKKFVLRCLAAVIVFACVIFFVPEEPFGIYLFLSFNTISVFATMMLAVKFLYAVSWKSAVFCTVGTSLSQHACVQFYRLICVLFIQDPIPFSEMGLPFIGRWDYRICFFVGYISVYTFVYFVFLRKAGAAFAENFKSWQLILYVVGALLIVYIVSDYVNRNELKEMITYIVPTLIACLALLQVLFKTNDNNRLQEEEGMMLRLLAEDQKHYEALKSSIDTINRKCHDLKYQVAALRDAQGSERLALAGELQRDIDIYENLARTGNAALDNTIGEKRLLCESKGIRFDWQIDGRDLAFMQPLDIYVLFGNALDNAIECVQKYEEKEKRVVTLRTFRTSTLLKIHFENHCEESVETEGGRLFTSKPNKAEHGFGTRSIRYIVQKYGGNCVFTDKREEELFCVDILFPCKEQGPAQGEEK